ncbi:hypothetical protein, partial [Enterococcus faecalis]|uniref:hypothetical protein n=1 Tax=Enterococcus faecalis TaxID=1351 RepID=UPI0039879ABC
ADHPAFSSFYFNVLDAIFQNQVDQLIAGMVAFAGNSIQVGQYLFPNPHGNNPAAILAPFFDFQRLVFHCFHPRNPY